MVVELTPGMWLLAAAVVGGSLASWAWIASRLVRGEELVPYAPRESVPWGPFDLLAILIASALIGWLVMKAYGVDSVPSSTNETVESESESETTGGEPAPGTDNKQAPVGTDASPDVDPEPSNADAASEVTEGQPANEADTGGKDDVAGQPTDEPDAADEPTEQIDPLIDLQVTAISRVLSLGAAFALLLLLVRATPANMGLSRSHAAGDVMLGVVAFFAVAVPIYYLQYVLAQWYPEKHPLIRTLTKNHDGGLFLFAAVVAVIIAPLTEEFLFRSFLQGWLEKIDEKLELVFESFSPPPRGMFPVLTTSILFAAAHVGSGPAPVPLFFLSLVLGYLYYRTHRILPCIVLHMCLNGCSMFVAWQMLSSGAVQ